MYESKEIRATTKMTCMCCGHVGVYTARIAARDLCYECFDATARHKRGEHPMWKQCRGCDVWYNRAIQSRVDNVTYKSCCSKECRDKVKANDAHKGACKRRAHKMSVYHEPVNRRTVFMRDKYRCKECNVKVTDKTAHMDHIMPISKGGSHTLCNLQTLCSTCNIRKADKLPIGITLSIFTSADRNEDVMDKGRTHKYCNSCNITLPVDKFTLIKKSYYRSYCNDCHNELRRQAHNKAKQDMEYINRLRQNQARFRERRRYKNAHTIDMMAHSSDNIINLESIKEIRTREGASSPPAN